MRNMLRSERSIHLTELDQMPREYFSIDFRIDHYQIVISISLQTLTAC